MNLPGQHRILKLKKKKILQNTLTERILREIKSNLSEKDYLPGELILHLAKWINIQLKHGSSMDEIAKELNNIKMPTLSGRGSWNIDNIDYLMNRLI